MIVLVLVYNIFQHLCLASGRRQFRAASLLCTLFIISLFVAIIRLIVLCTTMQVMYARLAFDTLTDFEAFFCACAASIPAVRVLMRDYNSQNNTEVDQSTSTTSSFEKPVVAFPEKWSIWSSKTGRSEVDSSWEESENVGSLRTGHVSGQGWAKSRRSLGRCLTD